MERENKISARLVHYWEVAGERASNRGPYGISLSSIAHLQVLRFGSRPIWSPPRIAYPGLFLPKLKFIDDCGLDDSAGMGRTVEKQKEREAETIVKGMRIGRARGSW